MSRLSIPEGGLLPWGLSMGQWGESWGTYFRIPGWATISETSWGGLQFWREYREWPAIRGTKTADVIVYDALGWTPKRAWMPFLQESWFPPHDKIGRVPARDEGLVCRKGLGWFWKLFA